MGPLGAGGLCDGALLDVVECRDDRLDLNRIEDAVNSPGTDVDEGRGIEEIGFHPAQFGNVLYDHVDEFDLAGGRGATVEEFLKCRLGGHAIKADQRANEQAKAFADLLGVNEVRRSTDSGGGQQALQFIQVGTAREARSCAVCG